MMSDMQPSRIEAEGSGQSKTLFCRNIAEGNSGANSKCV